MDFQLVNEYEALLNETVDFYFSLKEKLKTKSFNEKDVERTVRVILSTPFLEAKMMFWKLAQSNVNFVFKIHGKVVNEMLALATGKGYSKEQCDIIDEYMHQKNQLTPERHPFYCKVKELENKQ